MPFLGYCLYVGGTLLALLFVADLYIPAQPAREEAPHTYNIAIASAQIPGQPITFSGETRDFGTRPPMAVADLTAKTGQWAPTPPLAVAEATTKHAARPEAKPARKKVARRKVNPNPENSFAQIPDQWRHRFSHSGMAFAPPFSW